jgi:serine/threonine-protein kinase
MATVYLAEDTRHHRKVAIKVLHPELSAVIGPERFLKEIELTANLQHPHILPLFDSGSADGLLYYVMPFIEGETLRARLTREQQLPIADSLRIATDVADALDYAHKRHVIHRDIKPENILLQDGRPVVADFGIALAVEQAGGMRMTQTGISLGTPQYMAPEQAMGDKSVDHRADIYALGAVVYEMLAGVPPFTGPNAQAIVARVITEKPRSLTAIRDTVPPHVDAAVYAALQKLPADRPATAREFSRALNEPQHTSPFEFQPAERISTTSLVGGIVLTAALFGLAGYALGIRASDFSSRSSQPSRLAMLTPNLSGTGGSAVSRLIAMTPDGEGVVYLGQDAEGNAVLYHQKLDEESPVEIPGSLGVIDPVISGDGRTIIGGSAALVSASRRNVSLPLNGGQVTEISSAINPQRAEVSKDGTVWYSSYSSVKLFRVTPDGKSSEIKSGDGLRFQQILSRNRAIIIRSPLGTASGPASILDTETGKTTLLTNEPVVEMRYGDGVIVYTRNDGTLWAAMFDEKHGTMTSTPVKIGSDVSMTGTGIAQFSVSRSGNLAYVPEEPRWLALVDRDGKLRYATTERRNFHSPKFAPDGDRISVDFSTSSGRDVWILSLKRGTMSRATFDSDGHDATWTPDGQFITYTTFKNGKLGVYRVKPGGGGQPDSIVTSSSLGYTGDWLPDGKGLVTTLRDVQPNSGSDIGIMENAGKGPFRPLIANQFQTQYPAVSPDGKWLAFVSDQSGAQEVYVRPLEGSGEDVQVSLSGGTEVVWSHDGSELFYRGNSDHGVYLVAAKVRESPTFDVVSRTNLFPVDDMAAAVPHANYDVSHDGKTFALVRRSPATRIVVIQNLREMVKSLQAPGKSRGNPNG